MKKEIAIEFKNAALKNKLFVVRHSADLSEPEVKTLKENVHFAIEKAVEGGGGILLPDDSELIVNHLE